MSAGVKKVELRFLLLSTNEYNFKEEPPEIIDCILLFSKFFC